MIQTLISWAWQALFYTVAVGVPILLLIIIIGIVRAVSAKKNAPKKRFKSKASGIIFGKKGLRLVCSPEMSEGMVVVFGGTGSGKTSAILVPTLRAWRGTAFVIDISGDIEKVVPDPSKIIFAPESANTTPYSPFATIDMAADIEEKQERLMQIAFLLLPNSHFEDGAAKYYEEEARKMLQAALVAYYFAGLDFCEICRHIVSCGFELLIDDIKASGNDLAVSLVSGFDGGNEKTIAGVKQEVDKAVMLFATNPKVARSFRRPADGERSVYPAILETNSVYIVIDDFKLELYTPLLRLITTQTLEYLSTRQNKANPPILLCLDEFASLGKMDIIPALRKLRKKNVRIMVLTQSLADLDIIYGTKERRAMLDNLAYTVVLSASDNDTQKYFSDLAGERKVVKKTYTLNKDGERVSESQATHREKIIFPEEFARLEKSLVLLHPGGVMKLKKNFYYKRW
jgi:type IV secretory pathway TraG/TraD family ATPase VirD4